jgi:hypothetical protein
MLDLEKFAWTEIEMHIATCISPTYADGLLYVRTRMSTGKTVPKKGDGPFSRLVCYDLRSDSPEASTLDTGAEEAPSTRGVERCRDGREQR